MLFVYPHRLLRDALPVFGVSLLDLLELGLKCGHGPYLAALLHRQGDHDGAYDDGKDNDAKPEAAEENAIQQHQAVDHRLDNYQIPEVPDYFHGLNTSFHSRPVAHQWGPQDVIATKEASIATSSPVNRAED